ncbi:peptidoglycan DD-metalloendopeptidase family protein [Pseudoalteromonas sp. SR43-6]|jgi:murein DD-endopeptidase MepM/ murein hydrolase activator NlpD|uniref:Peptidoglycan DD-metalloendopeptidase family protein n=1 Tax=Pseudoalteromonas distincta TaxID=77608 RepID=A0ABT9GK00_9GAMM|nr:MULTISPECIES: peptidoglycan DD-metalloendopeptidase family protein [Pseudoalteromonas]KAA1158404.1 peptidoglycan DD-metalloendopeptidase family protein [Pseudoalteromonas distincta]KHM51046.1 peptidase M23 [Pseudoalteromonas elyakovii]KID40210.1 peptidase M23 [Pseudoalteromonas distincta]MBB1280952.1 peptidoglycan DD-metalloendopeptidase family protein [Pseudoalteromonas sp. SR41-1]MBB1289873.1 peptidoglycan DD-metalloendopeptidase family protein [Pseudoalteromonas sp. SR41-5]|tara:strand:- start:28598 stop:29911 length:1314 start_codon:yes stop_codon:yes gene_type:complete
MVHVVHTLPKKHKLLILGLVSAIVGLAFLPSEKATASKDNSANALEIGKRYELQVKVDNNEKLTELNSEQAAEKLPEYDFVDHKVKNGDNLAIIFKRAGFSAQTLHKLINTNAETRKLTKIHPGEILSFATAEDGSLAQLRYVISKTDTLFVTLNEEGNYDTAIDSKEIETLTKTAGGEISNNFWTSAIAAGLSERQIMNFADIFGWDVDFANDIRKGDVFGLIYESHYVDGEFIGTGKIIAAEFVNQGQRFAAIRHTDGNFYTPEGRSMKKAFLRAPVSFKYISSSFNPRRLHPVTGQVRAHRGIDFAARTGTPVVASGNGKVIKAGYSKYNGNYVFISHGTQYVTKYLHLNKKLVKTGQKVKQGQQIGTVGSTGRVTGAHLHYEFLVNGVHRNPKTVKLPKSEPLPRSELAKFKPIADNFIAQLERNRELQLALK